MCWVCVERGARGVLCVLGARHKGLGCRRTATLVVVSLAALQSKGDSYFPSRWLKTLSFVPCHSTCWLALSLKGGKSFSDVNNRVVTSHLRHCVHRWCQLRVNRALTWTCWKRGTCSPPRPVADGKPDHTTSGENNTVSLVSAHCVAGGGESRTERVWR